MRSIAATVAQPLPFATSVPPAAPASPYAIRATEPSATALTAQTSARRGTTYSQRFLPDPASKAVTASKRLRTTVSPTSQAPLPCSAALRSTGVSQTTFMEKKGR